MGTLAVLPLVLAMASPSPQPAPPAAPRAGPRLLAAVGTEDRVRVIVALDHDVARPREVAAQASARATPRHLAITRAWDAIPAFAAEIDRAGLEALLADPRVRRVDLDHAGRAALAESVTLIHADAVQASGVRGEGLVVALLDSGVDAAHPDLAGRLIAEHCFCTAADGAGCCPSGATEQSGPGSAADDAGHGTMMAGVIAGRGAVAHPGVAPGVGLVAVKVLDGSARFSSTAQVLSALDWLLIERPDVRVVNMSLATYALFDGECDQADAVTIALSEAIGALARRGAVVVAASGNDGEPDAMAAPACIARTLSVGAVHDAPDATSQTATCTAAGPDQVACFSDSSEAIDLLAPGAWIDTPALGGGRLRAAGTSHAAAHVAGAAALLLEASPALSPEAIAHLLSATGSPVVDRRSGRTTPRIDARRAVASALGDSADLAASLDVVSEQPIELRARVRNHGPRDALARLGFSVTGARVASAGSSAGPCTPDGTAWACPLGVLASDTELIVDVTLSQASAIVEVEARVEGEPPDPRPANDTATVSIDSGASTVRLRLHRP